MAILLSAPLVRCRWELEQRQMTPPPTSPYESSLRNVPFPGLRSTPVKWIPQSAIIGVPYSCSVRLCVPGGTFVSSGRSPHTRVSQPCSNSGRRLLRDLETYICGQSDIIIDYATTRHQDEPISTAVTESTVQRLLHRRMNAQQHMRWSPRGAHLMLKVRAATANGTLERDHAVAERWGRRPFRRAA